MQIPSVVSAGQPPSRSSQFTFVLLLTASVWPTVVTLRFTMCNGTFSRLLQVVKRFLLSRPFCFFFLMALHLTLHRFPLLA
jgi:hypothetical protein